MTKVTQVLIDFIEQTNPVILSSILVLMIVLLYFTIVFHSHSSFGGLHYGKYKVIAKDRNDTVIKVIVVSAWNKINAVERAAKQLETFNEIHFKVNKL
jgi:hypothetical protein